MVTENVDRSDVVREATKNQNVFHVTSQGNADGKAWCRLLQDELLDEANDAKVLLTVDLLLLSQIQ